MMTNQEIFDKIVSHMRTQKYSCAKDGHCLYYDPETGRKCAVGCLIPTEMYIPEMDEDMDNSGTGLCVNNLIRGALGSIGVDLESSIGLLSEMQKIHDGMFSDEWGEYQEQRCQEVARKHNLVYTI